MDLQRLILGITGRHVVPCLLVSAVIYAALRLLFGPARLHKSAQRVAFLNACLLKAALALWVGVGVSCFADSPLLFVSYGIRLPDLIPDGLLLESQTLADALARSDLAAVVLATLLAIGLLLLCWRWARLAPVCRHIHEARSARREFSAEAFQVFEDLVAKAYLHHRWLPRPRLKIVWDPPSSAFAMGILRPTVVLSAALVQQLGIRELRGILAHELAHIRRFDYIGRWVATVMRDILVWNPFALMWHAWLVEEQERASDESAAELLDDPVGVASGLVEAGAYELRVPLTSVGLLSAQHPGSGFRSLEERIDNLVLQTGSPNTRNGWPPVLFYPALAVFLAAELRICVSLPGIWAHLYDLF